MEKVLIKMSTGLEFEPRKSVGKYRIDGVFHEAGKSWEGYLLRRHNAEAFDDAVELLQKRKRKSERLK